MPEIVIDGKTIYFCNNQEMPCVIEAQFASDKELLLATAPYREDDSDTIFHYVWVTDIHSVEIMN